MLPQVHAAQALEDATALIVQGLLQYEHAVSHVDPDAAALTSESLWMLLRASPIRSLAENVEKAARKKGAEVRLLLQGSASHRVDFSGFQADPFTASASKPVSKAGVGAATEGKSEAEGADVESAIVDVAALSVASNDHLMRDAVQDRAKRIMGPSPFSPFL
jgi:hypothetical protein